VNLARLNVPDDINGRFTATAFAIFVQGQMAASRSTYPNCLGQNDYRMGRVI
jgi:hypothetical protein